MMSSLVARDIQVARLAEEQRRITKRKWTLAFDSGRKWQEGRLVGGVKEGLWTCWHRNGRVHRAGAYLQGKREGRWVLWQESGRKMAELHYIEGRLLWVTLSPVSIAS
jgi:antitoxin component YwqK of YwqJK toxin-antitoxin module